MRSLIRLAAKVSMAVTSPGSTVLAASARSVTDKGILRRSSRDSRSTTTSVGPYLSGSVVSNGYALASDYPQVVERLAIMEAVIPGLARSPMGFVPQAEN